MSSVIIPRLIIRHSICHIACCMITPVRDGRTEYQDRAVARMQVLGPNTPRHRPTKKYYLSTSRSGILAWLRLK
jgi:hypothetical protein